MVKWIALSVAVLLAVFGSCTNNPASKNDGNGKSIVVSGTIGKSLSKGLAVGAQADSIVAIPCVFGEFTYIDEMRHATIKSDGTFSIPLSQTFTIPDFGETPVDWVLLLVDSRQASRFDQVIGYVGLKDLDQSLIKLPINKAKGDVDLGTMKSDSSKVVSSVAAKTDTANFSLTLAQLREMMRTGKTLKIVKNVFANYHGDNGEKIKSFNHGTFAIGATYTFRNLPLNAAYNRECLPDEYIDTSACYFQVGGITFNSAMFDYAQIMSRAISFDLYPPKQINYLVGSVGDPSAQKIPITCFSTDSTKNPTITTGSADKPGSQGIQYLTCWVPDDRSDPMGFQRFAFGSYSGVIPDGKWQLKKNTGEVISEFDLGLGNPFDERGKPRVYVPSVNVTLSAADSSVTSVTIKWYSWDAASQQYLPATDLDLLKTSISWAEANLGLFGKGEKIWFGISSNGQRGVQDISLTMVASPTVKMIYNSSFAFYVGYRMGGQSFNVMFGK
jgi:hypothetical protein